MTKNYLVSKGAVANCMSNFCGSDMIVVDMGIKAPVDDIPGLIDRKIAHGTQNCAKGPAMTREQAIRAIETGIELVNMLNKDIAVSCLEKWASLTLHQALLWLLAFVI